MSEANLNVTQNEQTQAVEADEPKAAMTVGELEKTLIEIRDANVKQAKSQSLRTVFMGIFAGAAVALALTVILLLSSVMPRLEATIDDLNTVTSTLTKIDIVKIADEISALAVTGTEGINQALTELDTALAGFDNALKDVSRAISVLESIDIEGLNKSIGDLSSVVGPLAMLFGN